MGEYFDLGGKTALIVGGTSGIGLAVARRFTAAGCRTTVAGRSAKRGCDTDSLEFHACDLTVDASVVFPGYANYGASKIEGEGRGRH